MFFSGSQAVGGLTVGTDGALYGAASESRFGGGAVAGLLYRVTLNSTGVQTGVNTVYQFARLGVSDGGGPRGTLTRDAAGNFYGVTAYTTYDATYGPMGQGTIFKLAVNGTFTSLHAFGNLTTTSEPFINADGAAPVGSLLLASDGFLYGTTSVGGANGTGTIFKIAPDGTGFTILHAMDAASSTLNSDSRQINHDGTSLQTPLRQASNGDLFGTANTGGANGTGTIFTIKRDGSGFQVLRTFDASPATITDTTDPNYGLPKTNSSGAYPASGLIQASNGYLYGTTTSHGANSYGTIYRLATDGTGFAPLQSFSAALGAIPVGELIVANDGTLVGTTSAGATRNDGSAGAGMLYSLTLDGATLNTLYIFGTDGAGPTTGVVQTSDGSFYGTTSQGGPYGYGTVYKFGAPTNAPVLGTPVPYDDGGSLTWLSLVAFGTLLMLRTMFRTSSQRALESQPQSLI